MRPRFRGAFWPSRTQELLLDTAFAPPGKRADAWHELGPAFDLRRLEMGSVGVLPLVYRVVAEDQPDDPHLDRLKGIYRSTWVKNNLLVERLAETLQTLRAREVEPLLVDGLAAAARYYPEVALRPTPTIDFVIRASLLVPASRALGAAGWSAPAPLRFEADQPISFSDADGHTCVLRTTPAVELPIPLDELEAASVGIELNGSSIRTLAVEHDLLAACAEGARAKPVRSIQWLVDVCQILRVCANEISSERLLATASRHGQTLRLRRALEYVGTVLGVAVPAHVKEQLERASPPARERAAFVCAGVHAPWLGSLPQALAEHLVATRTRSAGAALASFPEFLRRRWSVAHSWELPVAGSRRAFAAITSRRRGR